jgi:Flp pilus assembly protein TadD
LKENPNNGPALVGSGLLAEREGDASLAVAEISHAMKVEGTDVGYILLARALRRAGQFSDADAAFAHAQQISQDFAKAQQSADKILDSAGVKSE